jgi:hypothetical protein
LIGRSGIADGFRLATRVRIISKNPILNKHDAQVGKFLVNPISKGSRKIFLEFINYRTLVLLYGL